MGKTGKADVGRKSFTVTRLSIFGIGHTCATFQLSGKISLSIELFIMWTIGDVIWSTTGLRNFTGILTVMTAGTIVVKFQDNLLDFIVGGIVDGKCVGIRDPVQQL